MNTRAQNISNPLLAGRDTNSQLFTTLNHLQSPQRSESNKKCNLRLRSSKSIDCSSSQGVDLFKTAQPLIRQTQYYSSMPYEVHNQTHIYRSYNCHPQIVTPARTIQIEGRIECSPKLIFERDALDRPASVRRRIITRSHSKVRYSRDVTPIQVRDESLNTLVRVVDSKTNVKMAVAAHTSSLEKDNSKEPATKTPRKSKKLKKKVKKLKKKIEGYEEAFEDIETREADLEKREKEAEVREKNIEIREQQLEKKESKAKKKERKERHKRKELEEELDNSKVAFTELKEKMMELLHENTRLQSEIQRMKHLNKNSTI